MKIILSTILMLAFSPLCFAASYEDQDFMGRLNISSSEGDGYLAIVTISKASAEDNVLGTLKATVNVVFPDAESYDDCEGQVSIPDPLLVVAGESDKNILTLLCNNKQKVLQIKMSTEREDMASYLNGSMSSAKLYLGERPVPSTEDKYRNVDVKNLSFR